MKLTAMGSGGDDPGTTAMFSPSTQIAILQVVEACGEFRVGIGLGDRFAIGIGGLDHAGHDAVVQSAFLNRVGCRINLGRRLSSGGILSQAA